ncbi:HEAT repeat domain-containing protein [Streptomyces sp. T-3]|nr:HEAT repeat domain-containing protein [Streptomyces sp. T-3]
MDSEQFAAPDGGYAAIAEHIDGLPVAELAVLFERSMTARIGTFAQLAARRLGHSQDPAGVDAALRVLNPPYPPWSPHAAVLLGLARADRSVPALIRCLPDPMLPAWQRHHPYLEAVTALARIGTQEAADALITTARSWVAAANTSGDTTPYVQRLVQALCAVGTPKAVDAVFELTQIMRQLWDIPTARAVARRADRRFVPFLVELLAGPRRPEGLLGLERVATARAAPALMQILQTSGDRASQYSAARALAVSGVHAATLLAPGAYRNRQAGTTQRRATAWILGRIDAPVWQTKQDVTHLLADQDAGVRARATASLGQIGDPTSVPLLLDRLADPCHRVRARAATALGRIGSQEAQQRLEEVAQHDAVRCVREAAGAAIRTLDRRRPTCQ